jgi:hypothetical protein
MAGLLARSLGFLGSTVAAAVVWWGVSAALDAEREKHRKERTHAR